MTMRCEVLNPLKVANWDDLLPTYPEANFFHTQTWAKVLSETYGYEPKYFSIFGEDGLRFLLPMMEVRSIFTGRRGVSLPFTDHVQPLVTCVDGLPEIWQELVGYAKKSRWQHIDLRGEAVGQTASKVYDSFYQHEIQLEKEPQLLFDRLSSNNKRNIKKAIRQGVDIEIRDDMSAVDVFYNLNSITRKRHGVPSQPYGFFKNLFKYISSDGRGIVVLAKKEGTVIAASVYLFLGKSAIYKYGASNQEAGSSGANNLVMWEAINWLSKRGFNCLSLGRTDQDNLGLLRYKNGWAAEQKTINYYRYNVNENRFVVKKKSSRSLGTRFFRTAPVAVSNILGGVLYRHVG